MPQVLPFLSLGLGIFQTIQGMQAQKQAIAAAKEPRLSEKQQQSLRERGTSNITANLAARGVLDSSLLPGGLSQLEKDIGEAAASAGTMGNYPALLSEYASGLSQGGAQNIGGIAQLYLMNKLFGGSNPFENLFPSNFNWFQNVESTPNPWENWGPGGP